LWRECSDSTYINLLVHAPCEAVARALLQDPGMPKQVGDLLAGTGPLTGIRAEPVYVYQLRGHDWTQVESSGDIVLGSDLTRDLSRELSTLTFYQVWEDVACASVYEIFEGGELVESYSMLGDNPMYRPAEGQEELRRRLAEGWRISQDHTYEFFSRRGTRLDVESPEECHALMERVVRELRMFIACGPWTLNDKRGRVELWRGWEPGDFTAAMVLYHG
jgi:hypothetical protein